MRKIWNMICNVFASLLGRKTATIEQSLRSTTSGRSNDVRDLCARAMLKSEDKDEFMNVFYWGRQVFAFMLAVVYGVVPLKGTGALLLFIGINIGIVYLYAANRQNKKHGTYIGAWELMKNGFITSSVGFIIVWLIVFRTIYTNSLIAVYKRAK